MTRVKFCGLMHEEDVARAVKLGLMRLASFYAPSSRGVTPDHAAILMSSVPAFVTRVGLFVNDEPESLKNLGRTRLNLIQYHGDESPEFCDAVGLPFIKALRCGRGLISRLKWIDIPMHLDFYWMHT